MAEAQRRGESERFGGCVVISRKTSSSRPCSTRNSADLPAMRARQIGDIGDDVLAVAREDQQALAVAVRRPSRPRRPPAAATIPRGICSGAAPVATRRTALWRRERRASSTGVASARISAMSDDDRPAAHRLDLFEQMGRDDDRLVRPHLVDDLAHLVFLVGVEPVGRLVEDQHLRDRAAVPGRRRHAAGSPSTGSRSAGA